MREVSESDLIHPVRGASGLGLNEAGYVFKLTNGGPRMLCEAPKVLERIEVTGDGAREGERYFYVLEHGGQKETCSGRELNEGTIWAKFPGLRFFQHGRQNIANAACLVEQLAEDAPMVTGHTRTGWQNFRSGDQGGFGYVFPDGRVLRAPSEDSSEDLRLASVQMLGIPEGLRKPYEGLPFPAHAEEEEMRDALAFVRDASRGKGQALSALGSFARGLSYGIERAGYTVIIEGPSSTGKTSIANLARSLAFPYEHPAIQTLQFSSTVASLEADMAFQKSFPVILDDLAISANATPKDVAEAERKIDLFVRANFNDSPVRNRMRRDMTRQESHKVETTPIITAERLPAGMLQSVLRRSLLLTTESGDADLKLLRDSGKHAPALAAIGHGVILNLSRRIKGEGKEAAASGIKATREEFAQLLSDALEEALGRSIPQIGEELPRTGAEVLVGLKHLEEAAGLTAGELTEPGLCYLAGTLASQIERMEGRDEEGEEGGPFGQLMAALAQQVRHGLKLPNSDGRPVRIARIQNSLEEPEKAPKVRLPGQDDNEPPHVFGFHDHEGQYGTRPAETVGFVEEATGTLYLMPLARKGLLMMAAKEPGCEYLVSDKALGTAAESEGWIKRRENGKRRTVKKTHRGTEEKGLWALDLYKFLGFEPEPKDGPEPEPEQEQKNATRERVPESEQPGKPLSESLAPGESATLEELRGRREVPSREPAPAPPAPEEPIPKQPTARREPAPEPEPEPRPVSGQRRLEEFASEEHEYWREQTARKIAEHHKTGEIAELVGAYRRKERGYRGIPSDLAILIYGNPRKWPEVITYLDSQLTPPPLGDNEDDEPKEAKDGRSQRA